MPQKEERRETTLSPSKKIFWYPRVPSTLPKSMFSRMRESELDYELMLCAHPDEQTGQWLYEGWAVWDPNTNSLAGLCICSAVLKLFRLILFCVWVFCLHVYVCTACMSAAHWGSKKVRSPGTRAVATVSCHVVLRTEPSLQP